MNSSSISLIKRSKFVGGADSILYCFDENDLEIGFIVCPDSQNEITVAFDKPHVWRAKTPIFRVDFSYLNQ